MDNALAAAIELVMNDMQATGDSLPQVEDAHWSHDPGRLEAGIATQQGEHGMGIFLEAGVLFPEQLRSLADQIQDWAVEARWSRGDPAVWPECPRHPGSHPLSPRISDSRAVWCCPLGGVVIGAIGDLNTAQK